MIQRRISKPSVAVMSYPTAHITLNKSRIKTYPYNQIFMADGSEFQIELDNCTPFVFLAMISINGEKISDSGLVLKPGEHIFLDTPDIGSDKKKKRFKFETYEIEQGRSHLVADNGKVKIDFYKERIVPDWLIQPITTHIYHHHHQDITPRPPFQPQPYWINDTIYYSSSGDVDPNVGATLSVGCSDSNTTFTTNACSEQTLGKLEKCSLPAPELEETGRIEKGSKSKQKFTKTNYDFESYIYHTEEFQLFPLSKRVTTVQEATREYCTQCGKKRKKNFQFCPKCGTKF